MTNFSYNAGIVIPLICGLAALVVFGRIPGKDRLLVEAAARNDTNAIARLLAKGARADGRTRSTARSALMSAAAAGHADAVQILLERGADKSAKDRDGRTAFDHARPGNHTNLLDLLRVPQTTSGP